MFGFGRPNLPSGPIFIVGQPSIFSKNQFSPTDFGREITRLSFDLGIDLFERYQTSHDNGLDDLRLLEKVKRNPGIMQLLYVNLITGAFLCYAKLILKVPDEIVAEVENGVLVELRSRMPGFSEEILDDHKKYTASFSIVIGREVLQLEKGASIKLFFLYFNNFYPEFDSGGGTNVPNGLFSSITGYGSRVMAQCQDNFKITFQLS